MIETSEPISEDPLPVILKYLYNYQDFHSIVEHMHDRSCINLYSLAYAMQMPKLLKDLEDYIVDKIINPSNAQKFYIEGIRFKNNKIIKLCEQKVLENFNDLCNESV
jgi:hypothetical protein